MRRGFIVLGMHRSGTSALTRVLNILGCSLPSKDLLPAAPDNPAGFWEHTGLIKAHEDFFAANGSAYYGPVRPWHGKIWESTATSELQNKLLDVLRRDFVGHPNWIAKEPRICRLLPAWLPLFPRLDVHPSFLLIFRDPAEVAVSLRKRENLPEEVSYWLWLAYVLDSERASRGYPRVRLTYDELMNDWWLVAQTVADSLQLELARGQQDADAAVCSFLDPNLRHHKHIPSRDTSCSLPRRLAHALWDTIREPQDPSGGDLVDAFDRARQEWEAAFTSPGSASLTLALDQVLARAGSEQRELQSRLREIHERLGASEQTIRTILSSKSWRITEPLRRLRRLVSPR